MIATVTAGSGIDMNGDFLEFYSGGGGAGGDVPWAGLGGLRADGQPLGYGCGTAASDALIPDRIGGMDFLPACIAHDQCYDSGTTTPRAVCDQRLGEQIYQACSDANYPGLVCLTVSAIYRAAAELFGGSAYDH